MSDFVIAKKIETFCKIGCTAEERAFPQRLLVSARLGVDTRQAASTAELGDSVCYATVCALVRELASSRSWVLVEELAETCASRLFEQFALISDVNLVVEKFVLPGVEWTGIEINRRRH
jgi:dihydroneopterin aldolase